jgi:hypothetical protein
VCAVTVWLPWLLVGASAAAAAVLVRWLSGRLPAAALRAEEAPAPRSHHAQAEQQAVGGHRG